jgi:Flp pilus assembly protein TadB
MHKIPFFKSITLYLVVATFFMTLPAQGWAMFIPSEEAASVRRSDMAAIQKTLESSMIKQRLSDYGLSSEEALAKVNQLSQEQIHQVAENLDSLQAGADGVDALIFLLLVAIIVVVILEVTGHRVIVK